MIYGGGGSNGGAVARAYAREGASVFLAGRTESRLTKVAVAMLAVALLDGEQRVDRVRVEVAWRAR